jgi:hypothetical protein
MKEKIENTVIIFVIIFFVFVGLNSNSLKIGLIYNEKLSKLINENIEYSEILDNMDSQKIAIMYKNPFQESLCKDTFIIEFMSDSRCSMKGDKYFFLNNAPEISSILLTKNDNWSVYIEKDKKVIFDYNEFKIKIENLLVVIKRQQLREKNIKGSWDLK